ncbi:hypothetical protein DFO66_10786 [Brevibacterium sanguinis]|uniref:ABC-2 family transporter n=2 Tax=Brevibacterium TaxID=1696 RepID=A0A366IL62_9MICO|nr:MULTISPECIES: hypothetical protein [Brevibacterium]RBP64210.1 hypothetical protein DFO66_10786 [Brevibacterium sanguinis]RBP71498.1 hypothetical protein DFO65_10598 [Brevibacterium celere]
MNRTREAFALITADRKSIIGVPLAFTGAAFLVVLGVGICFLLFSSDPNYRSGLSEGMKWSGAVFTVLGPLFATGALLMANTFELALGLSLTRREYTRAALCFYLVQAVIAAVVMTLVRQVEVATNGWGLSVRFFDVVYLGQGPWWQFAIQAFLVVLLGSLLLALITICGQRWRRTAWYSMGLGLLVVVAVVVLVAALDWNAFREFLALPWTAWMAILAIAGLVMTAALNAITRRYEIR